MIYEIVQEGNFKPVLKGTEDDGKVWWIPMDESNPMYQAYLAEQSTPMVTDEASTL
jgi:hypothetical protein